MVPQEDHTGLLCTQVFFIQFHYLTDGSDLLSLSIVFRRCLKQNQVIVGPVSLTGCIDETSFLPEVISYR